MRGPPGQVGCHREGVGQGSVGGKQGQLSRGLSWFGARLEAFGCWIGSLIRGRTLLGAACHHPHPGQSLLRQGSQGRAPGGAGLPACCLDLVHPWGRQALTVRCQYWAFSCDDRPPPAQVLFLDTSGG